MDVAGDRRRAASRAGRRAARRSPPRGAVRAASSAGRRRSCGSPTAAEDVGEAVVEPRGRQVAVCQRAPAVVAELRDRARRSASSSVVTAPPSPVVTIFRGWKLRQAAQAERAARPPLTPGTERAGRVLDHRQVGQLLQPAGPAEEMDGDDRLRARRDAQPFGVEVHRHGVDVDEHGTEARERDDVRGRREGVGGNEDRVARGEPERLDGEVERRRTRGDREGMGRPAGARAAPPRTPPPRGPCVSMPLSSTPATAASSSAPVSGRASRIRSTSPGTTRSSVRGRRRARPGAPSRAARAPSRRSGSAARRRRSRAGRRRSRRDSRSAA